MIAIIKARMGVLLIVRLKKAIFLSGVMKKISILCT